MWQRAWQACAARLECASFEALVLALHVFLSVLVVPYNARAQEPPPSDPQAQQVPPQQSPGASATAAQTPAHATPSPDDALDNPVLEQADEARITYAQTLRVGLNVELDRKGKWSLSPYFEFPLNHFTRITEIKNLVGVDLSYNF